MVGWSNGRPAARASSLTGGGLSLRPLPLGLSGWQTTATTSSPWSRRACSEGTAKSGVPMKMMRYLLVATGYCSSSALSIFLSFFL